MGKSIYRAGVVLGGDFNGKSIYKYDDNKFIIISNDENGKIIINSLFPTRYSTLKDISKSTVERYEDISSTGGFIPTYDMAIYFKDGQKSLVRLNSSSYQMIKQILFVL